VQRRAEAELRDLAQRVVEADFPFLGACYGVGVLGGLPGGVVDRQFGEPITAVRITLTDEGMADPLLGILPREFDAFLGHKEAISRLPDGAVRLAGSATCPVQAFRIGRNVYATQFHPELDIEGICLRIETYRHHGYFDPPQAEHLQAMARASHVEHPTRILERFVELYAC
jgi:GMP synthase (glutamine-hydrolysing)